MYIPVSQMICQQIFSISIKIANHWANVYALEYKFIIWAKEKGTRENEKTNIHNAKTKSRYGESALLSVFKLWNWYQDFQNKHFIFCVDNALAAVSFCGFLDIGKAESMCESIFFCCSL